MARKQLEAYNLHQTSKRENRHRAPQAPVHDRIATDAPKAALTGVTRVPCPSGDGSVLRVTRNLRGDTLAYLRDRRQIDEHQFQAGRYWQAIFEAACGTIPAMDTTKEPVDGGGRVSDGLTDKRKEATKALLAADLVLKAEGSYIMRHIAGSGVTLAAAAEARGVSAKTLGQKFRGCLDILAVEFNLADRKLLTLPVNGV